MATSFERAIDIYFSLEGRNHGNRQLLEKRAADDIVGVVTITAPATYHRPTTRATRRKDTFAAKVRKTHAQEYRKKRLLKQERDKEMYWFFVNHEGIAAIPAEDLFKPTKKRGRGVPYRRP